MQYRTLLDCPVCGCTIDVIKHDEPKLAGIAEAMLGQDARTLHAEQSPECTKDARWSHGWRSRTLTLQARTDNA